MSEPILSTMWAQNRFTHLRDFFAAAREMGFRRYELNHQVTEAMLEGISPGEYEVASLHAPCPQTIDLVTQSRNDILPSSLDEEKRKEAVSMVRRTVEWAAHLGASSVVLHLGRVNADWKVERKVREAFQQGKKGKPRYRISMERLKEARALVKEVHLEAVTRSLAEIAEYARPHGVKIGLENRCYYLEIPNYEEMATVFNLDPLLYYWHDTGHAQALENLGFTPQEEWLRTYGARMLGVHLHDIVGLRDHGIPGQGEMEFGAIAPHIPSEALHVFEFDYPYSPEEVVAGWRHLEKTGCL